MENLLRMSGLLGEDDDEGMDLGALEIQLAKQNGPASGGSPDRSSKSGSHPRTVRSHSSTPQVPNEQSPTNVNSAEKTTNDKPKGVEELSDLMCSLVTNNCGDTRYLGMCFEGEHWMPS